MPKKAIAEVRSISADPINKRLHGIQKIMFNLIQFALFFG